MTMREGRIEFCLSAIATVWPCSLGLDDKITLFVITIGGYFG